MDEEEYLEQREYYYDAYQEYLENMCEYYKELENSQDISKAADENNS